MKYFIRAFVLCILGAVFVFSFQTPTNDGDKTYEGAFIFSDDSIHIDLSRYKMGDSLFIQDTIDLCGKSLYLPQDVFVIVDGGFFRNGNLVGDMNYLDYKGTIFDKVHIKGAWIVPQIQTSMFLDLGYVNSLKDVFALSNPDIKNSIMVEDGIYYVDALREGGRCLTIGSNTDVTLDGIISLIPNGYPGCSVVCVNGSDITLHGNGAIVGDKHSHTNQYGEWGMGIYIDGGKNVHLQGILIKDCWGDCIYITKESNNIIIEGCYLDHGRRQGISVISADNVFIDNCTISNISGTDPQYAVDVEPNENDIVGRVFINNVKVSKCKGGFMCHGKAENSLIKTVKITNCTIDECDLCPLSFDDAQSVIIEQTKVINSVEDIMLICDNIDSVSINHNSFYYKKRNSKNRTDLSNTIVLKATKQFVNNNLIY